MKYLYLTVLSLLIVVSFVGFGKYKFSYKTIEYTLPVYELHSEHLYEQLTALCSIDSANVDADIPDYYILTTSRWEDTVFSPYSGKILAIYNIVLKPRVIHFDGMYEKDFCKSLLGCCRVGEQWLMMCDTSTLHLLFRPTGEQYTFRRILYNIYCLCMVEPEYYYFDGASLIRQQDFFEDERPQNFYDGREPVF